MKEEIEKLIRLTEERIKFLENHLATSKNIMNLEEVCKFTGLSKSHIYKLTCSSKIPFYKQSKHLYFDRLEIETWLKKHRIKPNYEIEQEAISYVTTKGRTKK